MLSLHQLTQSFPQTTRAVTIIISNIHVNCLRHWTVNGKAVRGHYHIWWLMSSMATGPAVSKALALFLAHGPSSQNLESSTCSKNIAFSDEPRVSSRACESRFTCLLNCHAWGSARKHRPCKCEVLLTISVNDRVTAFERKAKLLGFQASHSFHPFSPSAACYVVNWG